MSQNKKSYKPGGVRDEEFHSEGTTKGINTAVAKFDAFLAWLAVQPAVLGKRESYAHLASLKTSTLRAEHMTKNLFKHFSIWCVEVPLEAATSSSPASYIMAGTAGQYIGAVRNVLAKRFPSVTILTKEDGEWFTILKYAMTAHISRQFMIRGEAVSTKTPGLDSTQVQRATRALCRRNTVKDISVATAIVVVWQAVGRAGEIGNCTWEQLEYNHSYNFPMLGWPEMKVRQIDTDERIATRTHTHHSTDRVIPPPHTHTQTSHYYRMPFVSHRFSWEIDFNHALGRYLVVGGNKQSSFTTSRSAQAENTFMFPFVADSSQGGASVLSDAIASLLAEGGFPDLESATSKSLRVGSADHMSLSCLLNFIDMAVRGGWDFTGDCTLLTYITQLLHMIRAGKVLCGYEDPNVKVVAPSCDAFLTSDIASRVEILISNLLSTETVLNVRGRLRPFLYTMFASLVMYLPTTLLEDHLGRDHLLHKKLFSEALRLGFNSSTVLRWASLVRERWVGDNIQPTPTDSPALRQAQQDIGDLKKLMSQLVGDVAQMRIVLETALSPSSAAMPRLSAASTAGAAPSPSAVAASLPDNSSSVPSPAVVAAPSDTDDSLTVASALNAGRRTARDPSTVFESFKKVKVSKFLFDCLHNNISNFSSFDCFGNNIAGDDNINSADAIGKKKALGVHVYTWCAKYFDSTLTTLLATRPPEDGPDITTYTNSLREHADSVAQKALDGLVEREKAAGAKTSEGSGGRRKNDSVNAVGSRIQGLPALLQKSARPAVGSAQDAATIFFQPQAKKRQASTGGDQGSAKAGARGSSPPRSATSEGGASSSNAAASSPARSHDSVGSTSSSRVAQVGRTLLSSFLGGGPAPLLSSFLGGGPAPWAPPVGNKDANQAFLDNV